MCSQIFATTPPWAQTEHDRCLKLCMVSPHGNLLRVTEAIFELPLSQDIGVGWGTLGKAKNDLKFFSDFPNCFNQLN